MQITTINVNGIRAATKIRSSTNRGFLPWLFDIVPDVVLLQETRATDAESRTALAPALDAGWHFYSAPSIRKGHAGVGILSRRELVDVRVGLAGFEDVGRYIQGTYPDEDGDVIIASLYLPVGGVGSEKQDEKYEFLDAFDQVISDAAIQNSHMVIGGDWNICHREQDLKNYQANRKNSGCLPDERAFMDHMFGTYPDSQSQVVGAGEWYGAVNYRSKKRRQAPKTPQWYDVVRRLRPDDAPYTWWTYRGRAFGNDAGWRIDYQAATKSMFERATTMRVDKATDHAARWSDHAPLTVWYQ